MNDQKSSLVHLAAGGLGACVAASVTAPLDLVRVRLQSTAVEAHLPRDFFARHRFGTRTAAILRFVYAREGVAGLWRGIGPNLLGIVPSRAGYFFFYSYFNNAQAHALPTPDGLPRSYFASSCASALLVSTLMNPVWVIKTRMQLQTQSATRFVSAPLATATATVTATASATAAAAASAATAAAPTTTPAATAATAQRMYANSFDCLRRIVADEGASGLYRGMSASYLGITETALQMALYERFKAHARSSADASSPSSSSSSSSLAPHVHLALAAVAKTIATVTTYPHEVLRTRLRELPEAQHAHDSPPPSSARERAKPRYTGLVQATRLIYREEGVLALYAGMGTHLLRVVPNAAIMFLTVELMCAAAAKQTTT